MTYFGMSVSDAYLAATATYLAYINNRGRFATGATELYHGRLPVMDATGLVALESAVTEGWGDPVPLLRAGLNASGLPARSVSSGIVTFWKSVQLAVGISVAGQPQANPNSAAKRASHRMCQLRETPRTFSL